MIKLLGILYNLYKKMTTISYDVAFTVVAIIVCVSIIVVVSIGCFKYEVYRMNKEVGISYYKHINEELELIGSKTPKLNDALKKAFQDNKLTETEVRRLRNIIRNIQTEEAKQNLINNLEK